MLPTSPPEGQRPCPGRAEARRGEAFTLGLHAGQWWKPWPLLCTPQPLFTFSFQRLRSQQQLGQGQREELKDPLCPVWILPRPPTEGGASAEVFVTQSCSDEISGTPAKRTACSLGSCQWRRPRQEDRDSLRRPVSGCRGLLRPRGCRQHTPWQRVPGTTPSPLAAS